MLETKVTTSLDFVREAYFTFDLKNYSVIEGAILKVYCSEAAPNTNVDIYAVRDVVWNENTVTWLTKPIRENVVLASVMVDVAGKYHSWNLSNYIKAEKAAGRNTVSFAMVNPIETGPQVKWNSKETGTNPPVLAMVLKDILTTAEETLAVKSIKIFPNPVENILYLSESLPWELYTFEGLKMDERETTTIDMTTFKAGVYYIKINGLVQKIIRK